MQRSQLTLDHMRLRCPLRSRCEWICVEFPKGLQEMCNYSVTGTSGIFWPKSVSIIVCSYSLIFRPFHFRNYCLLRFSRVTIFASHIFVSIFPKLPTWKLTNCSCRRAVVNESLKRTLILPPFWNPNRKWINLNKNDFNRSDEQATHLGIFYTWFWDAELKWYESTRFFRERTRYLKYLGIFRCGTS